MNVHKNIATLPIDCYIHIVDSIEKDKPDFRWLYVMDNYYGELPDKQPKNGAGIFQNLIYQFDEGCLNTDLQKELMLIELYKFEYQASKTPDNERGNLRMLNEVKRHENRYKNFIREATKNKGGQSFTDTCIDIERILGVQIRPFQRTVKEFFSLQKKATQVINSQQQQQNGKHQTN